MRRRLVAGASIDVTVKLRSLPRALRPDRLRAAPHDPAPLRRGVLRPALQRPPREVHPSHRRVVVAAAALLRDPPHGSVAAMALSRTCSTTAGKGRSTARSRWSAWR